MLRQLRVINDLENQNTTSGLLDPADLPTSISNLSYTSTVFQHLIMSTEAVSLAGSGLVFNNTFGSGATSAFKAAVTAAENFFQAHFTYLLNPGRERPAHVGFVG